MALSSNSLIHFTKNKTSLKGILANNFKVKYCLERIRSPKYEYILVVPMVSFCDIPLSEIKDHISKYGSYGIGLTKDWGRKNGLNPVLYVETNSSLGLNGIDVIYENILAQKDGIKFKDFSNTDFAVLDFFRYMKNYEGELIRKNKTEKKYRFSDEREWRFCPTREKLEDNPFIIDNYKIYLNNKDNFNNPISKLRLEFNPDDISYIILKSEREISSFVNYLENIKGNKYTLDQVKRLTTRIITSEQIKSDF